MENKFFVKITDNAFILDYSPTQSIKVWNVFTLEVVWEIVKHSPGIVYCHLSGEGDKFPHGKYSEDVQLWKRGDNKFAFAYCKSWKKEELLDLLDDSRFTLSEMWFCFLSDPNVSLDVIKPEPFFDTVWNVVLTGDTKNIEYQCFGYMNDGYSLIWVNPEKNKMDILNEQLEELYKVCVNNNEEDSITKKKTCSVL